jgi:hypothetical protein
MLFAFFLPEKRLAVVLCGSLLFAACACRGIDTYSVSGTHILKSGSVWVAGGVDAFDQFGPVNKADANIRIVREVIDDISACPLQSSDGVLSTSIGYLHPLEEVVANNRAQGQAR